MNDNGYRELIERLFERLGVAANPSEEGVYTLEVDGHFQVMIGCYQEQWLQLFCELGPGIPANDNLFGTHWPAHVQGKLDGQAILWSQHPIAGMDRTALEAWLERFIDDAEQRLKPTPGDGGPASVPNLLRI